MKKQAVAAFVIILIVIPLFSGCVEDDILKNSLPVVEIEYPQTDDIVSGIVKITGTALDADGIDTVKFVEIKIILYLWIFHQKKYWNIAIR